MIAFHSTQLTTNVLLAYLGYEAENGHENMQRVIQKKKKYLCGFWERFRQTVMFLRLIKNAPHRWKMECYSFCF